MRPLLPAATAVAAATLLAVGPLAAGAASAATTEVGGALLSTPGVHVQAKPGKTLRPLPKIAASSWVIADATTGEILAAKNAHQKLRPASTLKTLTAVTLLPELDPKAIYTPVYADETADGSKVGIVAGSHYTIDQLWYGLFLASGNDTAHALARANGGVAKTVAQMNVEAARLQANDTAAKTPSGLDARGQHSSAYDLALFSRAGLQMPAFAKYCSTLDVKFPGAGKKAKRKGYMTYNHNPLLLGGYKGAIGVKTGYTVAAGHTFVGAAKRGDRTILITIMNYTGPTYSTAASMLNWGFKNAGRAAPVGRLVDPLPPGATSPAVASSANATPATTSTGSHGSSSTPVVLLLVVLLVAGGAVAWLMRGRIRLPESDPLVAANKGLGRSGKSPRGRGGPRSY